MSQSHASSATSPLAGQILKPGVKWLPLLKEQGSGVLERSGLDDDSKTKLIRSAAEILGSGMDPKNRVGRATGLVVGYVQSGKTLSFTTVIGLARDNGFPLVILVAGTKDSLLTQSHHRLQKDLDVEGGDGLPAWIMEKNPKSSQSQHEQLLRQTIANWRDNTRDSDEKPTLLLTVLKHGQRINALSELLRSLNLEGVPTLVVDDEADQASLNIKVNQGSESTTYASLRKLRDSLPCHTFLQYTATPQAPLLINIADTLSPDFVHVLEPGVGYVGGEKFFELNSPYVKVIPAADIPPHNALPVEPPESLLEALRIFFVGLTASILGKTGRRSMLIHPAHLQIVHQSSAGWASAAKDVWASALSAADGDPDKADTVAEFRQAYADVLATDPQLPDFPLIVEKLPRALRNTVVIEFNTRGSPKTPNINWRNAEGWILVGGQAVDRGFTVDSLSVTYMPRGMGGGNADTIQQRARFFGYKQKYIGLCRIYLEQDIKFAFEHYVEHEQTMRRELKLIADKGQNLRTWRRRFVLDPALRPCRGAVISDPYARTRKFVGGWTLQQGALMNSEIRQSNLLTLNKLGEGIEFLPDSSYVSNEDAQKHLIATNVPMHRIVDALVDYRLEDPRDTSNFTALLVTISEALKTDAVVYMMRPSSKDTFRTIGLDGTIQNFLQGRTDKKGGYPGDHFFRKDDHLSVQIHAYDLKQSGKIVAKRCPLLAIYLPNNLAKDLLIQVQANQ